MTEEEMMDWIDNATLEQLMCEWRFAPVGDPLFQGEVGKHYKEVMRRKKDEVGHDQHVATSKNIGWKP